MGRAIVFSIVVCVGLFLPARSWAAPVQLKDADSVVYLGRVATMLVDPTAAMSVRDVATSGAFGPVGRLTDRKAAYWVRLTYTTAGTSHPWFLFLGYKPETADLYTPSGNGYVLARSGVRVPYAERPVSYLGGIVFALPPAPHQTTVFVRITSLEPDLTLSIDSPSLLARVDRLDFAFIVGLDSVLVAFLITSIAFFAMSRDRIYLLYAAYLFIEILSRSNETGLAAAAFWPHWAVSTIRLDAVFDALRVVVATLFVRAVLRTWETTRFFDYCNIAIVIVAGAIAAAAALGLPVRASWSWELAVVYVPVWILSAIVAWRRGEERAPLIVVAWSLLMIFSVTFALKQFGVARGNLMMQLIISHGSYVGVALQTVFLSLALSIDLRRLMRAKDRFERMAATDPLTEISNRRVFEEVLRREWNRALRSGRTLSLLMLDVDLFKRYNDRYGHAAGDTVLRLVAQRGVAMMRSSGDLFCRYGGEEFTAILPESDETSAQLVAERIRSAVEGLAIPHERSPIGILTVSIGVATERPESGHDPTELCERADQALYEAKRLGRNRTFVSASDHAEPLVNAT